MGFDAMANDASLPAISKDLGKKKRANRSAKLKQCKLDARREQWLSQVKNRGGKATKPVFVPSSGSEASSVEDERRAAASQGGIGAQDSDAEVHRKSGPSNSISSRSSIGSWSRSVSDAEDEGEELGGEKGGLDDWEAVADALSADTDHARPPIPDPVVAAADSVVAPGEGGTAKLDPCGASPRAWRLDDVFRPQSLPNLSKQRSFPAEMERRYGGDGWACHSILPAPTSCPICYEDLDLTDSSFLPCSCGFRLCLFCHKRILEADARCPGCRKEYAPMRGGEANVDGGLMPLSCRLSRSCSLRMRS